MGFSGKAASPSSGVWRSSSRAFGRSVLSLLPVLVIVVAVRTSGFYAGLSFEGLRASVEGWGCLAPGTLVVVYAVGVLGQIPGSVFVGAAVLAFGPEVGWILSYAGATLGNLFSFALVRWGRGARSQGTQFESWAQAGLLRLESTGLGRLGRLASTRPLLSTTLIRVVFPSTAVVSFALALTSLPFHIYVGASLLGVVPQLTLTVGIFSWVSEGF